MSAQFSCCRLIVDTSLRLGAGALAATAVSIPALIGVASGAAYVGTAVTVMHLSECAGTSNEAIIARLFVGIVLASAIACAPLALAGYTITLATAGIIAGSQLAIGIGMFIFNCCCSGSPPRGSGSAATPT